MTEIERILTRFEVEKLYEDGLKNVDTSEFQITDFFDDTEKDRFNNYKFSENEIKRIINISRCNVDMRKANILYRIEQHFCEKIGEPHKDKLKPEKRLKILMHSFKEYKRKIEYYNYRQEKRLINTKELYKKYFNNNRFKYFELLNIKLWNCNDLCSIENTTNENSEEGCLENKNSQVDLENENTDKTNKDLYTFDLSDVTENYWSEEISNSQYISEIFETYTDFQRKTMPTSTQNEADSTTI